jgi:hypothetical protein
LIFVFSEGFYTAWLIPIAIIGAVFFVYGYVSIPDDPVVEDICSNGAKYTMCPVCDHCPFWQLQQACSAKKLGYMFDNFSTCINSFLLSLWGQTTNLQICKKEFQKEKSVFSICSCSVRGVVEKEKRSTDSFFRLRRLPRGGRTSSGRVFSRRTQDKTQRRDQSLGAVLSAHDTSATPSGELDRQYILCEPPVKIFFFQNTP